MMSEAEPLIRVMAHPASQLSAHKRQVKESEMPKGVEHASRIWFISQAFVVKESEMPKGVEHYSPIDTLRTANSSEGI